MSEEEARAEEVLRVKAAYDRLNAAEKRQVRQSEESLQEWVKRILGGIIVAAIWDAIKSVLDSE